MATRLLYLDDAYQRKTTARVTAVRDWPPASEGDAARRAVILDQTVLYAESGGQAADHGTLRWAGGEARVVDTQFTGEAGDAVAHVLDGDAAPAEGDEVEVELDWDRRYGLMRHHTAAHVLSGVLHHHYAGTKFTGGQLYPDRARFDLGFENWTPELKDEIAARVNEAIEKDYPVSNYSIPREEFEKADDLIRTEENLVDPTLKEVRITDITGFDRQADGGTHVASTREVGRFIVDKVKNKGKGHRRFEIHVE